MKRRYTLRWMATLCLGACAGLALAAPADDYAVQWPLVLTDEAAGAHELVLGAEVYRQAYSPGLRDVAVLNAQGVAVPAQLFGPGAGQAIAAEDERSELRWFELPPSGKTMPGDWSMAVERDGDGRVLRLQARDAVVPDAGPSAWLVDASGIEGVIEALHLQWAQGEEALDRGYRLEVSDDLQAWRPLTRQVQLVDLMRGDERLRQGRVPVSAQARYLRLLPEAGRGVPRLQSVQAELAADAELPALQWLTISQHAPAAEPRARLFMLEGRYPVSAVDIAYAGNGTGRWTLYSREHADAPWRLRAGPWVAYNIGAGQSAERSPPQALEGPVRDREWKLVADGDAAPAPKLQLGWRAETLVFVAEGVPPYRLVAGSARAQRVDAPVAQVLEGMRRARGEAWRPGSATTQAMQVLAGESALQPAAPARDWRTWLLWALLVVGAALVAGFAGSLLRKPVQ